MSQSWKNLRAKNVSPQHRKSVTRVWPYKKEGDSRKTNRGDYSILAVTIILAIIGVIFVHSASTYSAEKNYGDAFFFTKKQILGFVIGLISMFLIGKIDLRKLRGKVVRWIVLLFPVLLLALVFVPGVGKSNYGATRWIGIGSFTIQPSELAKYGFVIFASAYASEDIARIRTFKGVLPILLAGGAICALILLEPNMSVTMCVGCLMLAMLFLAGMKWRHFLIIFIPVLLAIPVLIAIEPYRLLRLSAYLDPWASSKEEGYQLIQSLYALGGGGWFGTGLFNSRQKYLFLPFAESDFILAIIGEEVGWVGIIVLFSLSAFLVWKGIKTAARADDFFSYLLACGITLVYGIQTVFNALVVSGAIPPTGIPLPLVSAGNTSLVVSMASMGALYSLSKKEGVNKRRRKNIR